MHIASYMVGYVIWNKVLFVWVGLSPFVQFLNPSEILLQRKTRFGDYSCGFLLSVIRIFVQL